MFGQSFDMFGEGYMLDSRTSKFHENLVVVSRVGFDGDISARFGVEEEDAP
jgi:hypothetical protein